MEQAIQRRKNNSACTCWIPGDSIPATRTFCLTCGYWSVLFVCGHVEYFYGFSQYPPEAGTNNEACYICDYGPEPLLSDDSNDEGDEGD